MRILHGHKPRKFLDFSVLAMDTAESSRPPLFHRLKTHVHSQLIRGCYETEHHRLPKGVQFKGQGKLDLEAYLLQDESVAAFECFVKAIREAGGEPVVQPGVFETLARKVRRNERAVKALKHTIYTKGASSMTSIIGVSKRTHNVNPTKWLSPVIQAGEKVEFTRGEQGGYNYQKSGKSFLINTDELESNYDLEGASEGWQIVHEGLLKAYPTEAARLRKRAIELGIDRWLDWDFQMDDLERLTKPLTCSRSNNLVH